MYYVNYAIDDLVVIGVSVRPQHTHDDDAGATQVKIKGELPQDFNPYHYKMNAALTGLELKSPPDIEAANKEMRDKEQVFTDEQQKWLEKYVNSMLPNA